MAEWCQQQGEGGDLEIVEREPGTHGFTVQPRRWVVERSFAWLIRNRRLATDYERRVQTSETLIEVAVTRLLLRRLVRQLPLGRHGPKAALGSTTRAAVLRSHSLPGDCDEKLG